MSKTLVIVESPTKARTITRFLGGGAVTVLASQGHVRDLPERAFGVDTAHDFKPDYELTANGRKVVKNLQQAASKVSDIYLATDPDREGEAIAWHLQEVLKPGSKALFHRITFHEITQTAIQRSFANPGSIAMDMVDAQQARRVLDRIVGYKVSPLLWRQIQKGTSAGRVQTAALRLVVEREREIQAFKPQEYWNLDALFESLSPEASFKARLVRLNEEKVLVSSGEHAERLANALVSPGVTHEISSVTNTPRKKNPPPPFITSTLQQAAGGALHFGASQTMMIAQELYEGVNLPGGQVGLITYMRTDSVNIAKEAQMAALMYIASTYGPEYVAAKPNVYRSRKTAQEAHEAIRPTDVTLTPDSIKQYLTPQQLKLYRLIWNRFVASQMESARQVDHVIEVESKGGALSDLPLEGLVVSKAGKVAGNGGVCHFRAASRETVFPGFLRVYSIREIGEDEDPAENAKSLPQLPVGTVCTLKDLLKEQCFTQPPSRYTEALLVKALEQNGVGRPSTYAMTVNTIQVRKYVNKEKGSLIPTNLGFKTCDFLVTQMPELFNIGFTAQMEDELDKIEEGHLNWIVMLHTFYEKFKVWMSAGNNPIPANSAITSLIAKCFPDGFQFDAPVTMARRKFDDAKFVASVRERAECGRELTDRQWMAFLYTAAKYSLKHPEIGTAMEESGHGEEFKPILEGIIKQASEPKQPIAPELKALLEAMSALKFNPPVKRGTRTYDDGKFFKSIKEQAEGGKTLSEAQIRALLNMASNYSTMIENYAELSSALSSAISEGAPKVGAAPQTPEEREAQEAENKRIAEILSLLPEIKEWESSMNKRFDDKTFSESVARQFAQKGTLSPRQVSALVKIIVKYKEQIADYETRAKALGIESLAQPQTLNEKCPLCGLPLVVRYARGHSFVGCTGYPKCRYTSKRR